MGAMLNLWNYPLPRVTPYPLTARAMVARAAREWG